MLSPQTLFPRFTLLLFIAIGCHESVSQCTHVKSVVALPQNVRDMTVAEQITPEVQALLNKAASGELQGTHIDQIQMSLDQADIEHLDFRQNRMQYTFHLPMTPDVRDAQAARPVFWLETDIECGHVVECHFHSRPLF